MQTPFSARRLRELATYPNPNVLKRPNQDLRSIKSSPLGDGGELLALAVGDVVDDVVEAAEVAEGAADLHGVGAHAVEQVVHRVAPRRALSDEACCEGVFGYYVFCFQQLAQV